MRRLTLSALALFVLAAMATAQVAGGQAGDPGARERPLIIATKIAPPFVIEGEERPSGLSVELIEAIASRLGFEYELRVTDLEPLIDGVARGEYDAGISAISVTPERETRLDLTHGYYADGLGIAVPMRGGSGGWWAAAQNIFTRGFLTAAGGLALLLLVVGLLTWILERKANSEEFDSAPAKGIPAGFWFAAVTMTTVGYGDKSPRSVPGRALALVWMFASIIVISAFTGAIASSLTTAQIDSGVRGPEDLRTARVGVLENSATVGAMSDRGVSPRAYASIEEGLNALAGGQIDAFVHDWAILQYQINREFGGELRMLDARFNVGSYAIALPLGSEMRQEMNIAILEITRGSAWQETLRRYLGKTP